MQAIIVKEFGSADQLSLTTIPDREADRVVIQSSRQALRGKPIGFRELQAESGEQRAHRQ